MTGHEMTGAWWEPSETATKEANTIHALEWVAEIIAQQDGGDPTTETGWKSIELLELWLDILDVIDKAKGRT